MPRRQPEDKVTLDQVLRLVALLSPAEQEKLRAKLNSRPKSQRWEALFGKVQCKNLPPLSDAEILADTKAIRRQEAKVQ